MSGGVKFTVRRGSVAEPNGTVIAFLYIYDKCTVSATSVQPLLEKLHLIMQAPPVELAKLIN